MERIDRAAWYQALQPPPTMVLISLERDAVSPASAEKDRNQRERAGSSPAGCSESVRAAERPARAQDNLRSQIKKDEIVFTEIPIAAFTTSALRHCHHCCKYGSGMKLLVVCSSSNYSLSLATWPENVALPRVKELWPDTPFIPCECETVGFCSSACWEAAQGLYHAVVCPARCKDVQRRERLLALVRRCQAGQMKLEEGGGELGVLEEFPGLVLKIVGSIVQTARRNHSEKQGCSRRNELEDAYDDVRIGALCCLAHDLQVLGHAVAAPHSLLPAYDYEHFTDSLHEVRDARVARS
eukprot:755949-Hanusia_phi.AAC.4